MRFQEYEYFFSRPRMSRFLTAANGDRTVAKQLYRANLTLSESFLPLLSAFEVCLRNQLHRELAIHFGKTDWILQEKRGFMSDRSLGPEYRMRNDVARAEDKLYRSRRTPSGSNVLAEQNLGFWAGMFEPVHYRLLKGVPIRTFQRLPSGYGRKEVANKLQEIRLFRNRVYHNEPLCFAAGRFDLNEANAVHRHLIDLSGWLDPKFGNWMGSFSRIHKLFGKYDSVIRTHVRG
jgi:hypothetical protein